MHNYVCMQVYMCLHEYMYVGKADMYGFVYKYACM